MKIVAACYNEKSVILKAIENGIEYTGWGFNYLQAQLDILRQLPTTIEDYQS